MLFSGLISNATFSLSQSVTCWRLIVVINTVYPINEVNRRRAQLVLRLVTVRGMPSPSWYVTKRFRPTRPGHPYMVCAMSSGVSRIRS